MDNGGAHRVFIGKRDLLTDADLATAPGDAKPAWEELVSALAAGFPEGAGMGFEVKERDIPVIRRLAGIKRENWSVRLREHLLCARLQVRSD